VTWYDGSQRGTLLIDTTCAFLQLEAAREDLHRALRAAHDIAPEEVTGRSSCPPARP